MPTQEQLRICALFLKLSYGRRSHRPRQAFTLIELIMTMVVVSIVAIPLAISISQHLESVVQSQHYTLAVNLARFEMERVNNMNYTDPKIAVGTYLSPDYPAYHYDVTRTVACIQGDCTTAESLKRITVTVRKKGSSVVLINLVTYLASNIVYGT